MSGAFAVPSLVAQRVRAASRRPSTLGAGAGDAVSLAMGEPYADTSPAVVAAAIEALHAGRTRYERLTGSASLRSALADHLSCESRAVAPEEVVVTHGGSAGIAAAVLALVNPGDRVVIPEPTYSLYSDHVEMVGGEVVWVPMLADGSLDLLAIEAALDGARMVIVCNPNNPTGQVVDASELRALASAVARTGTVMLIDEAYSDIVFDDVDFISSISLADVHAQVITCGTFSKSYAMTGWRVGWVVAPEELADAINLVHRTINGALNTFVQVAAETALGTPATVLADQRREFELRRDVVLEHLDPLPEVRLNRPRGAFYAFPHIDSMLSSDEIVQECARGGVLVRSGREFGPSGEGHVRLSFATDLERLDLGLGRLVDVLRRISH